MPLRFTALFFLALSACLPAAAQLDSIVLTAYDTSAQSYILLNVNPTGSASTITSLPPFTPYQILHRSDNTGYRIIGQSSATGYPGEVLDVDAKGKLTTLVSTTLLTAAALMVADEDGDHLIATRAPNLDTYIVRLRGSQLTTVSTAVNLAIDGLSFDPESGQVLVRGFLNTPLQWGYYRVDPRSGAVTTFTQPPVWGIRNMGVGSRTLPYRGKYGDNVDLFVHGSMLVGALIRLDAENGASTLNTFGNYSYPSDLVEAGGRAFPVRYRALIYQTLGKNHSSIVDLREDGTALGVLPLPGLRTHQRTSMVRARGNHLAWKLTAPPNDRLLHLSFPGEGGRDYVVGASLSGVSPGLPLADGRVVPVTFDGLTRLGLAGGIPGVLEGTLGRLDASGRAVVKVNANALGPGLKGLRIWFAALVLDPSASSGVAHVVGPRLIELR